MRSQSYKSLIIMVPWIFLFFFSVQTKAQSVPIQAKKTQELKYEVKVSLKLIQVYVTDKKGNPVTDLNKNDFKIYDKKKLQKITEFERYALVPQKDKAETQPPRLIAIPAESTTDIMNRKFFFFFDLANNNAKGFLKAQQAAQYFIDTQLFPSDEVGVLSFSVLKGLVLHEYFTKDHQAIRNVVEQIGAEGRTGRADNFEALLWRELSGESTLDVSSSGSPIWSFKQDLRLGRPEHKNITSRMLLKLTDLAIALRYIPGHKHILLFSSGIPYSLIYGLSTRKSPSEFGSQFGLGIDKVLVNKYEDMLKELSNANTTVFSLNTEALVTNMNVPAQMKGELTLRRMSHYTGGKFLGNVQNYEELLDTVQTFTGSYYVLGYYIDESADGRYNSIEVSVTRPQCTVFAQRGYFNPKAFAKFSEMEKELHLIDLALTERSLLQTPVDFPMIALPCPVEEDSGVLLLAQIPLEKIKESIGQNAEIYFLAFDEKENLIDVRRKTVGHTSLKEKEAYYYSLMNLSPGLYKFRIVMRDMDSGNGAVGRNSMEIPASPEQGIMLYPPLLLAPGKSGLFVRGYVPKNVKSQFPLIDLFPFDPIQFSPILGKIDGKAGKIQAVLRCSMFKLIKPILKFTAALIEISSEQSTSLPVSILYGKIEKKMGTLVAEFQMPEMAPGEYVLVISAVDQTSQARSQTSTACRIY